MSNANYVHRSLHVGIVSITSAPLLSLANFHIYTSYTNQYGIILHSAVLMLV